MAVINKCGNHGLEAMHPSVIRLSINK